MIPIAEIIPENLYSQDDSPFLLGAGFTEDAARETICEACRSGELTSRKWRGRWWFAGREYIDWVSRWFAGKVVIENDRGKETRGRLAPAPGLGDDGAYRLGALPPENGKEVGT